MFNIPSPSYRDEELDLRFELASRPTSSYTPYVRDREHRGLLVDHLEGEATRRSFAELTSGEEEYAGWQSLPADAVSLAAVVAPTLTSPLPAERVDLRPGRSAGVAGPGPHPAGHHVTQEYGDDLVRGAVSTDGLIGCFASIHDDSPTPDKAPLHHVVGHGTGVSWWGRPVADGARACLPGGRRGSIARPPPQ